MGALVSHPDPINRISVELDEDLAEVHLVFECSSLDSAELIYRAIADSVRAGTMSFGGTTFSKTSLHPAEDKS